MRSYGTGRVFKRGARWWVAYYVDGRERREGCGPKVKTKADAQKFLRQRLQAADLGMAASTATVNDLLDLFVADQRNRQRKAANRAEQRVRLIREALGEFRVSEVSSKRVAVFVENLRREKRQGSTINRYRAIWVRAFKLGSDAGLNVRAPHWPRMAENPPKRDYITDETFAKIVEKLAEPFRSVALAAYWTACRRGEILAWTWTNLDLAHKIVLIPEAKSGTPRRVPLAQPVWAALTVLAMIRDRDWPASPWVFTMDGSRPLTDNVFRCAWDRACKAAGVGKVRFHGLRHTAITNYRAAGVEEGTIMAMSGHTTRSVFDRYGIQPEERLHDAVSRLEKRIRTKYGQSTEKIAKTGGPEGSLTH